MKARLTDAVPVEVKAVEVKAQESRSPDEVCPIPYLTELHVNSRKVEVMSARHTWDRLSGIGLHGMKREAPGPWVADAGRVHFYAQAHFTLL